MATIKRRKLQGVPFGLEMLNAALPWMLSQMEKQGWYHTDHLKRYLDEEYDIATLRKTWSSDGPYLWQKYCDWLTAHMTRTGLHKGQDKRYSLTKKGLDRAKP